MYGKKDDMKMEKKGKMSNGGKKVGSSPKQPNNGKQETVVPPVRRVKYK